MAYANKQAADFVFQAMNERPDAIKNEELRRILMDFARTQLEERQWELIQRADALSDEELAEFQELPAKLAGVSEITTL